MTEEIREKFQQFKLCGERNAKNIADKKSSDLSVIEYMDHLLHTGELCDFKDVCFAMWNISDSYAMLRKSDELYKNHQKFTDFVSCNRNEYKFYPICDTSQRFTLILGGYGEFWHELYCDAVENVAVTDKNYRVAYEAHRAAMSVNKQLDIPIEHLQYASEKFSYFLNSCKESEEYDFYKLIFDVSYIRAFEDTDIDIERSCANFYDYLYLSDNTTPYVVGEWEYLNRLRSRKNRAVVGITSAVNALIDTGQITRAFELYSFAKKCGLPENVYVNKRLCHI